MRRGLTRALLVLVAAVALAAPVWSAGQAGYLAPGSFDILAVLPPAPAVGGARDAADRSIFLATRALVGTPRWQMATDDVKTGVPDMLRDFSCAAGIALTPDNARKLAALVARAGRDTGAATNVAKDHYKRLRPYKVDPVDPAKVCEPEAELDGSYDYPSGHTTWGWTWATILAELIPDHAAAILARGRAYGESRAVCGAHNYSAVQGGWLSASATLAAVRATPAYQADVAAARAELDALRHTAPDAKTCAAEAALVSEDILSGTVH
ncbi:MAG: phosphatase PAP2 family protein [Rhizomicrobium sp.]